jgi:hypothetical protein
VADPVEERLETHDRDGMSDPLAALLARDAGDARIELEILAGGECAVDRDRFRDVTEDAPDRKPFA